MAVNCICPGVFQSTAKTCDNTGICCDSDSLRDQKKQNNNMVDHEGCSYSRLWPQVLPRHQTDTVTRVWKHGKKPARVKYRGYEPIFTSIFFSLQIFFPFSTAPLSILLFYSFFNILVQIILPTPRQILKPPSVKTV